MQQTLAYTFLSTIVSKIMLDYWIICMNFFKRFDIFSVGTVRLLSHIEVFCRRFDNIFLKDCRKVVRTFSLDI